MSVNTDATMPFNKPREQTVLHADCLDFGILTSESTMMIKRSCFALPGHSLVLYENLRFQELTLEFPLTSKIGSYADVPDSHCHFVTQSWKLRLRLQDITSCYVVQYFGDKIGVVIRTSIPPRAYRKARSYRDQFADKALPHNRGKWVRQTDEDHHLDDLRGQPIELLDPRLELKIGRWTTYRLLLTLDDYQELQLCRLQQTLMEHDVDIRVIRDLHLVKSVEPELMKMLDSYMEGSLENYCRAHPPVALLSYALRYQLEVCISKGILEEHSLRPSFMKRLLSMDEYGAYDLLVDIAAAGERIYQPMSIFASDRTRRGIELLHKGTSPDCVTIRSVSVTPTTLRLNSAIVETSNRVMRWFPHCQDRFLRVRFTEESQMGKIYADETGGSDEIYARVKRALTCGLVVAGRHFQYLASGNTQFREHGAYFFAPLPELGLENIRAWMGSFAEIKNVALYNARLGQCFSTTRAISLMPHIEEIQDVVRNGFVFSDGVGKISPDLALLVAGEMCITGTPSVFQFRLGGCKGIFTTWPDVPGRQLRIRRSQYKFPATHEGLEIIRWSQFTTAYLNRQLILVLSSLGVPDTVFIRKLKKQLSDLDRILACAKDAIEMLCSNVDRNKMTHELVKMISNGFYEAREPFLINLLNLWQAWTLKYLREKARITVSQGALLIGCLDETGSLKGHFEQPILQDQIINVLSDPNDLPEVFVQIRNPQEPDSRVILGLMVVARNPCLHPGDVRIVNGIDVSALRHLENCIAFPKTGDRDVPSMCSGGDLDGDDFIVIWDSELLPKEWNVAPLDCRIPKKRGQAGDITGDDLTSFFLAYMKNDILPQIALSHVANADRLGLKHEKCIRLAELHSTAVDYVKTGAPASMSPGLRPKLWPHFMQKKLPAECIYHSDQVLGRLYDQIGRKGFKPDFTGAFDNRILSAYRVSASTMQAIQDVKRKYDAQLRCIMIQFSIWTEFEVWSTFVMQHNSPNDFSFHEKIGSVAAALKEQFRQDCESMAKGCEYECLAPFVTAMYQITYDEVQKYRQRLRENRGDECGRNDDVSERNLQRNPFISFPWLFPDILGRIARRNNDANTAI